MNEHSFDAYIDSGDDYTGQEMSETTNPIEDGNVQESPLEQNDPIDRIAEVKTNKTFSTFTKVLVLLLLALGLTTATIAFTAPSLLAPIANILPDSLFPEDEVPPAKGFG